MSVETRVRRRTLVAAGVALVVAGLAVTAFLVRGSDPEPVPASRPTAKATATPAPRNGEIASADRHLRADAHGYEWRAFDARSDTGVHVLRTARDEIRAFVVVRPTGPVVTLTCGRELRCPPKISSFLATAATLGPGADEVTIQTGDGTAQVIAFDGTSRRVIDLTATVHGGAAVAGLRWSPDGSRLAVVTGANRNGETATRVWLVDRDGGHARLAYSLWFDVIDPVTHAGPDFDRDGLVWTASGWGWSPDGQTLLLDVMNAGSYGADVVLLHLLPGDAADPVLARTIYHSNRNFDWAGNVAWSPDGTRIAVRTMVPGSRTGKHRVTEISADDGSVIAQHTHLDDWLIWPARAS